MERGRDACNDQSLSVEHPDLLPANIGRYALLPHPGDNQVSEADGGGAGAQKKDQLLLELPAGDLERVDQPRERHAAGALYVVVVAGDLVAVAGEQRDRIRTCPVLEVDAALRENLLHGIHELVNECVQLLGRRAMLPQSDVERIA